MKTQFDGGEAIVEAFRKLGVEYILSSPGTEWAPVWEAMANQIHRRKEGPKLLDVWPKRSPSTWPRATRWPPVGYRAYCCMRDRACCRGPWVSTAPSSPGSRWW